MCGIAGIIGRLDDRNRAALKRMNNAMVHRGPDASGTWVSASDSRRSGVLLAHRRLSILDLSPAGAQPMVDPATGHVVVFNGEIYLLGAEQSAALRDKLLVNITQLESADEAADWVHKNLPSKNALATADAELVESAFRDRLATIASTSQVAESAFPNADAGHDTVSGQAFVEPMEASTAAQIILPQKPAGRSRRVAAKTIRLRDKEHCKFVTTQPCVVCGRMPSEAHHIRFAQPRALGRKVSDEYTVPVCRLHHRELHRYGDEPSWWGGVGVDPVPIALELWRRSQSGDPHGACALPPTADDNAPR
jgi:hypothetical protein